MIKKYNYFNQLKLELFTIYVYERSGLLTFKTFLPEPVSLRFIFIFFNVTLDELITSFTS